MVTKMEALGRDEQEHGRSRGRDCRNAPSKQLSAGPRPPRKWREAVAFRGPSRTQPADAVSSSPASRSPFEFDDREEDERWPV
jgi:hypothetical protein